MKLDLTYDTEDEYPLDIIKSNFTSCCKLSSRPPALRIVFITEEDMYTQSVNLIRKYEMLW